MEEQGGQPGRRRLVGIDLGIASRHSVRVLEADGQLVCRSSCVPTVKSLTLVEQAALDGAAGGTRLAVVSGPTGPAWMPIAVFFARRGHAVYRVSSAKASDLRRFLRRHAKSNGIDAETLARIPLADPGGLQRLELPGAAAAALDRRVRACDRLTRAASEHKVRTGDLVRQLMPMTPLTGDLGKADLAVLEHFADPRALLAAGTAELTVLITSTSGHQQGGERAAQWRAAAAAALDLYGDHTAVAFDALAGEVATEVRLLRAIQAGLAAHAAAREQHYRQADPGQLARSLPGFAEISAPVLVAVMGRPGRFRDGTRFKSYAGLAPRASETGETDRKGQPMSKAGPSLLRATLFRAAGTARRQDPQLARIYYLQMTERGGTPPAPLTPRVILVILLTMTVLPLGDVKSHLSELVGRVHDHHERVTVTVHGRPSAILIAPEDLEALEETLEIMRDAATMNRLAESDAELARGEYVSAEELAEALRRRQAQ